MIKTSLVDLEKLRISTQAEFLEISSEKRETSKKSLE